MSMPRVQLGDVAKDSITGFHGVVICISEWLHGCRRITLKPTGVGKDGKTFEPETFDEPQLSIVKRGKHAPTNVTGGPRPEPTKPTLPR